MPAGTRSSLGPLVDMLMPYISATRARVGDQTGIVAPGGLMGVRDIGQDYLEYINKRERERMMTPLARRLHYFQANLAKQIGLHMGMTPDKATLAATRVSAPSMMAWAMMKANKTDDVLRQVEDTMRKMGTVSPLGLGRERLSAQQYNNRIQSVMDGFVKMVLNPKLGARWGNIRPDQIVNIVLPRYARGEYNDILQNPKAFDRRGNLTRRAKLKLFGRMSNTTQAINELQYLFPGTDPMQAYKKMESFFGEDPIQKLGPRQTKYLFKDLRSTARATGISNEDMISLLANIGTAYKQTGRDPMHALSSARDMMLLSAASRKGIAKGVHPGKFNQAMMANVAAARHSKVANMLGLTYSALKDRVGGKEAKSIIAQASSKLENVMSPKKFLTDVNRLLGPQRYKIDPKALKTYIDSPSANYFKASGFGTMTLLNHYAGQMMNYRKKVLKRKFKWTPDQLSYLDQLGGPTVQNIQKYVKQMGLPTPDLERRQIFEIQQSFNNLAKKQGFEKASAADRFISGVTNIPALRRYKAATKRGRRVSEVLEKYPRPGGLRGLTQFFAAPKGENWWEALTGSRTLGPKELAELQGVDLKKMDKPTKQAWEKAMGTWLFPERAAPQQRTEAYKTLGV